MLCDDGLAARAFAPRVLAASALLALTVGYALLGVVTLSGVLS
jgi:hypothetical protein